MTPGSPYKGQASSSPHGAPLLPQTMVAPSACTMPAHMMLVRAGIVWAGSATSATVVWGRSGAPCGEEA
eukprot:15463238-Alexandrium_andersonii.AAC.1